MHSIIDVNINLSRYPTRRLPDDEPELLVRKLKSVGVSEAWAGSFDALLHRDIEGVNLRLKKDCERFGQRILIPFGTVNPALPDWKEDFHRCVEKHHFRGIRLFPAYHRYLLNDKRFVELLHLAEDAGAIVQIVMTVEDARTQHPLLSVSKIDSKPLIDIIPGVPNLKLMLLNAFRDTNMNTITKICENKNVSVDIAMLEGVQKIRILLEKVSVNQILFGSYFPFFYIESALLKMKESQLNSDDSKKIFYQNAKNLISE